MLQRGRQQNQDELVTATEIACWLYCPEQWRLQYGLGLEPENRKELAAGEGHHARKAAAERLAGGSIAIGRFLAVAACVVLVLLLAWWLWVA
jgi:hypothetical protein